MEYFLAGSKSLWEFAGVHLIPARRVRAHTGFVFIIELVPKSSSFTVTANGKSARER